jgi:hypothetical protein
MHRRRRERGTSRPWNDLRPPWTLRTDEALELSGWCVSVTHGLDGLPCGGKAHRRIEPEELQRAVRSGRLVVDLWCPRCEAHWSLVLALSGSGTP